MNIYDKDSNPLASSPAPAHGPETPPTLKIQADGAQVRVSAIWGPAVDLVPFREVLRLLVRGGLNDTIVDVVREAGSAQGDSERGNRMADSLREAAGRKGPRPIVPPLEAIRSLIR